MKHSSWVYLLLVISISCNVSAIVLEKVYHHRAPSAGQMIDASIQVGTCCLYFSGKPEIQKRTQDGTITFFIASIAKPESNVQQMISACNAAQSSWYQLRMAYQRKPQEGLYITLAYDPKRIDYDSFFAQAVGSQQAWMIRFYNKQLLQKLDQKNQPILRLTQMGKMPKIMIDCGHGGDDTGAKGIAGGIEKDITLSLGLQVAQLLKKKGFSICMTRHTDQFVSLEQRTYQAMCQGAHLLISIHVNAASNKQAQGIETYCLPDAFFLPTALPKKYAQLYAQSMKCTDTFARMLHEQTIAQARQCKPDVIDRKVKKNIAQVLLIDKPAALIEVGFISNCDEEKHLLDPGYQQCLVRGICNGIIDFCSSC